MKTNKSVGSNNNKEVISISVPPQNEGGMKEQVKQGNITAYNAFRELEEKAVKAGGQVGLRVFHTSKAAKWLRRRF